jgi:hypothetical protein
MAVDAADRMRVAALVQHLADLLVGVLVGLVEALERIAATELAQQNRASAADRPQIMRRIPGVPRALRAWSPQATTRAFTA